jgi:Mor family transcriptional regulator
MARQFQRDAFDLIDFTKQNLGLDEVRAERFGRDLVKHFCGDQLYISRHSNRHYRNTDIRSSFNGRNYKELARDYGLSERQIYTIVHP